MNPPPIDAPDWLITLDLALLFGMTVGVVVIAYIIVAEVLVYFGYLKRNKDE